MTREYALVALRCAALRVQLTANEINLITIAVRDGIVSPEAALVWARDAGVINLVGLDDCEFDAVDALEAVP